MEIEGFLSHWEHSRGCSPETLKAYRSDLKHFEAFLKSRGLRISQVRPSTINDYIAEMTTAPNPRFGRNGLSEATMARRLAAVSSYYDFVRVARGLRVPNPASALRRRWRTNKEPKAVPEPTLEILLKGADNLRDKAILALFLATGFRLSELGSLNRDSIQIRVETQDGKQVFSGAGRVTGKGSKARTFFVDGETLLILKAYLSTRKDPHPALFLSRRGTRISGRMIQEMIATLCRRLGLEHIHPHQLRHSFATRLANADMELRILTGLMGHSSPATTQRYYTLTDKTLARGYFAAMEFRNLQ